MEVRHATSVQGPDDPTKSVNANEWNEPHILSDVASVGLVEDLSAAVSVVAANLSTLSVQVSGIETHIDELSDLISTLTGGGEVTPTSAEFVSLEARVSQLSVLEGALSGIVSANHVQLSALSVAVSVVRANVSTLSVETSAVRANVSALSVEVSTVRANVSNLSVALSVEQTARATLSGIVSANAAVVSALSVQVSTVAANVSNLSVALSAEVAARAALSATVSSNAAVVSALSVAVSVVAANLSTLSVQHGTLSALHSTLSAQHSALSTLVAGIGGGEVTPTSAQFVSLQQDQATKKVVLGSQIISVSALTDISGMGFSVGAGNTYAFKYLICYRGAAISSGLGISVTFPGMTTFAASADIQAGADGASAWFSGSITSSGDRVQALSVQTSTLDYLAIVEGVFMVSTTGSLQLQANSELNGDTRQVIIKEGTMGAVWRTNS